MKYDCYVYFIVCVIDWCKYSLLFGLVNLFFDGIYVGKFNFLIGIVVDIFVFSLGCDEGLIIECEC